jgi:hypothetical protein
MSEILSRRSKRQKEINDAQTTRAAAKERQALEGLHIPAAATEFD